jgi:type IV secretory pathway VirB10-like protein
MLSNRLAFAALAVACIGAAAGGGYLASRQNVVPAPASAEVAFPASVPAPAVTAEQAPAAAPAVQETEAVVGDQIPSAPAVSTPAAAPRTASSRKVEAERPAPPRARREPAPSSKPAGTVARQDQPPPLTSSWPSSASSQPPAPPQPPLPENPAPHVDDRTTQEPPRAPEPPQKTFEELVVSADSVIGLQTESRITSETARVEDRVEARVTRDVKVGDRVAIPSGAHAIGSVVQVERGGKFKERARLGIRFHTLVLADGTRVPISTETIYRDGEAPGNATAAKVGGAAVGGAILGAILGGAKGAVIGSTAGAGAGTAAVMAGDRSAATLPAGTPMTVRLQAPVTVTKEE